MNEKPIADRSEKRRKLRELREQQIFEAALEVFSKNGYHETDVERVAELAGVGKGTVYRYFETKKNLFLSLVEWGLNNLRNEILAATREIDDVIAKIETALKTYLAFFERNKTFYRVLIEDRGRFREEVEQKFKEKYFSHLYLLEETLRSGIEQKVIKPMDVHSAALALVGSTNALIYKWLISEKDYPLENELPVIMETFFWGIAKRENEG